MAEKWIQSAIKNPGSFTRQAKRAGEGVQTFARHVLANKEDYSPITRKRAALARTLAKMH